MQGAVIVTQTHPTKRQIALNLLRAHGPRGVTGNQLLEGGCGTRYGARIQELREHGHRITSRRLRNGLFLYTLIFDVDRGTRTPAPGAALDADAPPTASRGGEQPGPTPGHGALASPTPLFQPDTPIEEPPPNREGWGGSDYDPDEENEAA